MRVLGIDIGGTFTDLALLDLESGRLETHKLLTTPEDPVRAVVAGARDLMARVGGARPDRIVHGTTLVTNAIVERKGAATALLTTRGFRDVLEIRREGRYDLYDLDLEFPEPLVPRERRYEAAERLDASGAVLEPLDEPTLRTLLGGVAGEGPVASWAVSFLHSYAEPAHERRAGEILSELFPGSPVSLSHETAAEIREYERTSTVVANAYVRPVVEGYLRRLAEELGGRWVTDPRGPSAGAEDSTGEGRSPVLHIMLSDGGLTTPEIAARHPIRIVESGPAGGVIAAARLARGLGEDAVLALDMGGTTAKIAFLDRSGPRSHSWMEVDRRHLFKKGSGLPVLTPALDLVEIGAGGGSLARRGSLGTLAVGPESAGADPGPACYGRGGTRATVTDADLVLGLLNPGFFLGGAMVLDPERAAAALRADVGEPLELGLLEAAHGVHTLVGSSMAEAARVHAAERGLDVSTHTLVAFGGAGPVHAWSVARQLRIRRILYPAHAGVESALGFLAAAPAFEVARSKTESLSTLDEASAMELIRSLAARAGEMIEGAGEGPVRIRVSVDMRYRGQGAEVRVFLPGPTVSREDLAGAFNTAYRSLYGRTVDGVPVETVTWRVRAERPAPRLALFERAGEPVPERASPPASSRRRAWLPDLDAPAEVPVYRREALEPGMKLLSPALIEEAQSTLVLGMGSARVLAGGAVLAKVAPSAGGATP